MAAVWSGQVETVRRLLAMGASPSAADRDGTTPLYAAALRPNPTLVRLLLAAGADPNAESSGESEGTPLCAAACWGHSAVVGELLAHGADPDQREDGGTGCSPLLWACRNGHEETVRLLLEAGADPNQAVDATTPLLAAAERGSLAIVRLLLGFGADPTVADSQGRTPLDHAEARVGKDKDVEAELLARASPRDGEQVRCRRTPRPDGTELVVVEVRAADGRSGRDLEQETGHDRIAELLRQRRPHSRPPRRPPS